MPGSHVEYPILIYSDRSAPRGDALWPTATATPVHTTPQASNDH
jgi:hypothetical protein